MSTLVNNTASDQILTFFLVHPTRIIHLRSLARTLVLSPAGISKALPPLLKQHLLEVEKPSDTNLTLLKAKREQLFISLKRSFNLHQLSKSGLLPHVIEKYGNPQAIILFGSYSRGEDTEQSDIDIAIITKRHLSLNISLYEKKLSRKIKILELSKEHIEKEFWQTLANGIVLYGYLELPL